MLSYLNITLYSNPLFSDEIVYMTYSLHELIITKDIFILAYCACCEYGEDYKPTDYMDDPYLTPSEIITVHDPKAVFNIDKDDLRSSSNGLGIDIIPPGTSTDLPYVMVDLTDPHGEFYVKV